MIELTIRLDPATGQVTATGPLDSLVLCLDLLAAGEKVVKDHHRRAAAQGGGITVATRLPPPPAQNGGARPRLTL